MVFEYTGRSIDKLRAWIVSQLTLKKSSTLQGPADIAGLSSMRIRLNIKNIESHRPIYIPIRGFPKDLQCPLHLSDKWQQ